MDIKLLIVGKITTSQSSFSRCESSSMWMWLKSFSFWMMTSYWSIWKHLFLDVSRYDNTQQS